jgi:DNA-binding MarR family transcriptional regulator
VSSDLIEQALRRFLVLGQAMRRDAETLPVSVAQSAVLARLRDGPKTVGELATAEGVRAPSMTQIINRMEEAGWVTRSEGPVRGRAVQITEAGRAVAVAVRKERTARLARRCDGLSVEDLAALEAVLPVLDRIFGDPAGLLRCPAGGDGAGVGGGAVLAGVRGAADGRRARVGRGRRSWAGSRCSRSGRRRARPRLAWGPWTRPRSRPASPTPSPPPPCWPCAPSPSPPSPGTTNDPTAGTQLADACNRSGRPFAS